MLSCNRFSPLIFILTFTLLYSLIPSSSTATNPTTDNNILYDIYPFIRVYKNGTIQRFIGQDVVPPNPTAPVHSKDVQITKRSNLSARIFVPVKPDLTRKLPLLVYFHGGGFFTESAFSPTYHKHLTSLVAKANVVAVSVNYRLAPENPLPVAYEDSWAALKWVFSHSNNKNGGSEIWLKKYADFTRVYLGGDSAGGNIAHQMGIRVGLEKPGPGVRIKGMFLNCPYFWGKKEVGGERAGVNANAADYIKKIWVHADPGSSGFDDPLVDPGMDPGLRSLGCERVLVYVAGKDVLRFRGWYYKEVLERSGWKGVVRVVEVEGEDHVFNLIDPSSAKAKDMLRNLAYFLNH